MYQPKALQTADLEPRPILEDITLVIPTLVRAILEECLHWLVVVTSREPAVYHHPRLKHDSMSRGNMGTSAGVEPIAKRQPAAMIRPPGATVADFSALCVRCGACVRVCPT